TVEKKILVDAETKKHHRLVFTVLVLAEEDRIFAHQLGIFSGVGRHHADVIPIRRPKAGGNAQILVRHIVEHFVTCHSAPPKELLLHTYFESFSAFDLTAGGTKKGATASSGPRFFTLLTQSELVADAKPVTRLLVNHSHELLARTSTPAHVFAGQVDAFKLERQVIVQV